MRESDWAQVCAIYLEGIATGHATFETQAPTWERWNVEHLPHSRLVARSGETIRGWAALSPVSEQCMYDGLAEVGIYVGQMHRGKGIGGTLLEALISAAEENGLWTLQASVFPENVACVGLYKRYSFREVGRREKIGKMNDVWRDELLLERRSKIVGAD